MPDGHSHSEYRHKSLESGVMRKYHAPFGGRPTEKGSIQSTSPAAHPTPCQAVNGGPLATASKSQVASSHGQADGLSDLCESSTAQ